MSRSHGIRALNWAAVVCLLVTAQSGCTSALTAAYLRDGLWEGADHAAESDDRPAAAAPDADPPVAEPPPVADRERREAALEEAMARLARLGPLDPAVEAAIVASLQRTEPEDWPVVVDEFAASLAAAPPPAALVSLASARAASATPSAPETPPPAVEATPAPADSATAVENPGSAADDGPPSEQDAPPPASPPEPETPPAPAPLAMRSACFASAVRGWGDVVRFPADRFRPGQEVIVYVELDNLSAGVSPAGHTTCIDAVVQLVDAAGRTLHSWSFDPLAETRAAPRRDYFARYVLRIPEATPSGNCRIDVEVTDALAGSTATAALPLEIAAE